MSLKAFRAQHPEYNDVSDRDLADALYKKHYADVPRAEFDKRMGLARPAAPKAPAKGRGSEADPYRVGTRYKVGSPEYQREVAKIPLGSYFSDPQGNLRQRMNPGAGQPIRKRQVERVSKGEREATGAAANVNRGLLIGDEGSALMGTIGNVLMGKVGPTTDNPLSFINGVGNSFNNELAKQRAYEDDFTKRRPWTAATARTVGMAPTLAVPGGAPTQAVTRGQAIRGAAGNAALYAGTAGLADRGTLKERNNQGLLNALVAAPLGGALTAVATRGPKPAPRAAIPTVDELGARKTAAYKAADAADVRYSPGAFQDLSKAMRSATDDGTFDPVLNPQVSRVLDVIDKRAEAGWSPSLPELDNVRKLISQNLIGSANKTDRMFGHRLTAAIDDFIATADGANVVSGSGPDAANLIVNARQANTTWAKTKAVTDGIAKAERRAGPSGSGGNIDNATRQQMRAVFERGRNWTPEEKSAFDTVMMGTKGQNALRQIGKLSPQGNGLMIGLNLLATGGGGATGGLGGAVLGAAPGAAGLIAKHFADKATATNVARLLEVIAQGGPQATQAANQIARLPNGSAFLTEYGRLGRVSGGAVTAANQNSSATVATATQ